eukprot:PhM_4_TR13354/c6_g1_i1/m.14089
MMNVTPRTVPLTKNYAFTHNTNINNNNAAVSSSRDGDATDSPQPVAANFNTALDHSSDYHQTAPLQPLSSSDLWHQFLTRLRMAGSTLEDIQECSAAVLHTLLQELGFSALQSARLETEWARRRPPPITPTRIPLSETSVEFKEVAAAATTYFSTLQQQGATVHILGVERVRNNATEAAFTSRQKDLRNPTAAPLRRWTLVPVDSVDRVLAEGFQALDRSSISAGPYGRGFAFSSQVDASIFSPVVMTTHKLVLADISTGNAKTVTEAEAEAHRARPMSDMLRTLFEEGYDSVVGRRRITSSEVHVVYHPQQVLPQYLVTFTINNSAATGGGGSGTSNGNALIGCGTTSIRCKDHPDHFVEFWCEEDARLVCSLCIFIGPYKTRRCLLLNDAASVEKRYVEKWVGNAHDFVGELGRVLLSFDTALDVVETHHHEQLSLVKQKVDAIKAALDASVKKLCDEVTRQTHHQTSLLQRTLSQLVAIVNTVEDRVAVGRSILDSGDNVGILELRQHLGTPVEPLPIPRFELPQVHVNDEQIVAILRASFELSGIPLRGNNNNNIVLPTLVDPNQILPQPERSSSSSSSNARWATQQQQQQPQQQQPGPPSRSGSHSYLPSLDDVAREAAGRVGDVRY